MSNLHQQILLLASFYLNIPLCSKLPRQGETKLANQSSNNDIEINRIKSRHAFVLQMIDFTPDVSPVQ